MADEHLDCFRDCVVSSCFPPFHHVLSLAAMERKRKCLGEQWPFSFLLLLRTIERHYVIAMAQAVSCW